MLTASAGVCWSLLYRYSIDGQTAGMIRNMYTCYVFGKNYSRNNNKIQLRVATTNFLRIIDGSGKIEWDNDIQKSRLIGVFRSLAHISRRRFMQPLHFTASNYVFSLNLLDLLKNLFIVFNLISRGRSKEYI